GGVEQPGEVAVALGGRRRQGPVDGVLQRGERRVHLRLGLVDGRLHLRLGGGHGGVGRVRGRGQRALGLAERHVRGIEGGIGERDGVAGVGLDRVEGAGDVGERRADGVRGGGEGRGQV